MLLDAIISLFLIPVLYNAQFNFDGFLNLANQPAVNQEEIAPLKIYTDYLDVKITAASAIAVDAKSGKVLYQKNSEEILPIASITKLMTALVFLDYNPGWQTEFYTIANDRRNGGIIYLNTGEILTLENLFKTALIVSDNDSAMALARASGLSEPDFIIKMNAKAANLGLINTQFVDPTGLNINNKSTVSDLVKLLNAALQNPDIQKTTSTAYYEFEAQNKEKKRLVKLKNTDMLLGGYLNVLGGKTGSLETAGNCLAVKIKGEQNQEIYIIVLKSLTNFDRFQDAKAIADWVFNNYNWEI